MKNLKRNNLRVCFVHFYLEDLPVLIKWSVMDIWTSEI